MLSTSAKLIVGVVLTIAPPVMVLRLPHALLALCLSCGQFDGRTIPVIDSVPSQPQGNTVSLRCGELLFEVPADAVVESQSPAEEFGLVLRLNGLTCRVLPPRHQSGGEDKETTDWADAFNRRGIEWQASSCRASERDLSIWMSQDEVAALRERLEAKMFLSMSAERVEVFNNGNLCGLLLIWDSQDRTSMSFEYFTPDRQVSGMVTIFLTSPTQENQDTARAIVNSLRIERKPDGSNKWDRSLAVADSGPVEPVTALASSH